MDWDGNWVVAEISSRVPMRGTAAGGSALDLLTDLNCGVVAKAEQIDATIAAIRANESKLTGNAPRRQLRFAPMLVATEGFPVTPHVNERIRFMLERAGLCQGQDTSPLVVLDIEALELAGQSLSPVGPTCRGCSLNIADHPFVHTGSLRG